MNTHIAMITNNYIKVNCVDHTLFVISGNSCFMVPTATESVTINTTITLLIYSGIPCNAGIATLVSSYTISQGQYW